ncbi:MAG: putative ABC transporter permease [Bacilli bacterium]|nr:putative ABC transporter permease [Bacilli bacterium]MBP3635552.1 putative ABC transporter permease [Bacilli bacterium]
MYYYLNYFFIFSILGHLLETIIFTIFDWNLESGFLYGYWTPVYGLGAVLILLISKFIFKKLNVNKFLEIIIFLIVITLVLTLIEFIGGNLLESLFKKDFWNYSNHKYHYGKYIALDISIIWMICSLIFLYLIRPWMDKIINKIPKFFTNLFIVFFILDLIFTIINKVKI